MRLWIHSLAIVLLANAGLDTKVWALGLGDEPVHLRVMAQSVPVRAGPGGGYRELARIGYGEIYEALDRSPNGYWFRIRLARDRSGWVFSELVWPFQLVDEAQLIAGSTRVSPLFAPGQLGDGRIGFGFMGGVLDREGLAGFRLGFSPRAPYWIGLSALQSNGRFGSLSLLGLALGVSIGSQRSVVPFAEVGAGMALSWPHTDVETLGPRASGQAFAGGGLMFQLRGPVLLRLEAQRVVIFRAAQQEGLLLAGAGLMVML